MGLGFTKPDPGVTDKLLLDAAWERAKQCEDELRTARKMASENHKAFTGMAERRLKLAYGIRRFISKHPELGEILGELKTLLDDE